jgi:hypothetical protein
MGRPVQRSDSGLGGVDIVEHGVDLGVLNFWCSNRGKNGWLIGPGGWAVNDCICSRSCGFSGATASPA